MEKIIKVDINNKQIGFIEKLEAHQKPILHRAFSVFLYKDNKILLQKRADGKYHSGGLWANSCCSHPRANVDFLTSVYDRLKFELGIKQKIPLTLVFEFTYFSKYADYLYEYEYDHVLVGEYKTEKVDFNTDEISQVKWVDINFLKTDLVNNPQNYATWFLVCAPKVIEYLENLDK